MNTFLVPEKTVVHAKGDGPAVEIDASSSRVFLLTLHITEIIEQESLDIGIQGSADGVTWAPKALASYPQKFYKGQHPLLLDLTAETNLKFVRAHWEVGRWGRGLDTPTFEFHISMRDVPPDILKEAEAEAKSLS
jgi:hypothetical protein